MEVPLNDHLGQRPLLITDRYELRALIGRGGSASVYRGWDRTLERSVAVKVIPSDAETAGMARRQTEAKLLASLNHGSLVTLHDATVTQEATYLIMEMMEGGTLGGRIRQGPLSPGAVASVAVDIASALGYIHAQGIVHRDVKPANVLLSGSTESVVSKLSDFGIAKLLDTSAGHSTAVMGTAQYLSPEQAGGTSVGPSSDVYSLGLTLIEALTGSPVFAGTAAESLVARIIRDPEIPRSLGYEWRSLLTAMTARDPGSRPAADLVARRARALQGGGDVRPTATAELRTAPLDLSTMPMTGWTAPRAVAEPPVRRRGARRPVVIGGSVVGLAVLAAVLLAGLMGPPRSDRVAGTATSPATVIRTPSAGTPLRAAPSASSSIPAARTAASTSASSPAATSAPAQPAASTTSGKGNGKGKSDGNGKGSGKGNGKSKGKG